MARSLPSAYQDLRGFSRLIGQLTLRVRAVNLRCGEARDRAFSSPAPAPKSADLAQQHLARRRGNPHSYLHRA